MGYLLWGLLVFSLGIYVGIILTDFVEFIDSDDNDENDDFYRRY